MGWSYVEGRFISTENECEENLLRECAEYLGMYEDYIDLDMYRLSSRESAQEVVSYMSSHGDMIKGVYVSNNDKVVAQDVRFVETYNIPVTDFIKNDVSCKKQLRRASKEYVIYDSINSKRLFGDTLEECIDYAIDCVQNDKSKTSMIHIVNRRFSKCTIVTAVCERFEGSNYRNIYKKQRVRNLYEYEFAGEVHH